MQHVGEIKIKNHRPLPKGAVIKHVVLVRKARKAALRVARLHEHVANQRRDFWHKTTSALVKTYSVIAIEDLSPRNSRADIKRQLTPGRGFADFCKGSQARNTSAVERRL